MQATIMTTTSLILNGIMMLDANAKSGNPRARRRG